MKILHITPSAPYNDYWGYQDNLLPKYQKKLGHDVTVITTNTKHENGRIVETDCGDYILNDGVRVIRRKVKKYCSHILTCMNARLEMGNILNDIMPDYIFFHGLVSSNIYDVIRYKKRINPKCYVVADNHLDYNNGLNGDFKGRIIRTFYRIQCKRSMKYIDKIYGVTPWRKKCAEEYFKVPVDKTDVLIMGADDEKVDLKNKDIIREEIRKKYNICSQDFLIVTGGKIELKKNIHLLMQACSELQDVKLLIFGSVLDDIKVEFEKLVQEDNIRYVGWIPSDEVYHYFFASDLCFFPGQHSVLWEQACAAKTPCVFQMWPDMQHVNNGGNSDFIDEITVDSLKEKILELHNTKKYFVMKSVAESDNTNVFLYSNIARKSMECVREKVSSNCL